MRLKSAHESWVRAVERVRRARRQLEADSEGAGARTELEAAEDAARQAGRVLAETAEQKRQERLDD